MYRTLCTTNSTNIMLMLVFYFVAVRIQDKLNAEPIRRDFIQYVFRRQSNRDCRIQTAKQSDGKNGLTKIFNKWFSEMILELFFFFLPPLAWNCIQLWAASSTVSLCTALWGKIPRDPARSKTNAILVCTLYFGALLRISPPQIYSCLQVQALPSYKCTLVKAHWFLLC